MIRLKLTNDSIGVLIHVNPRFHVQITCGNPLNFCGLVNQYFLPVNIEIPHTSP